MALLHFIRGELLTSEVCGIWIFYLFSCFCDLDLDPMTFIYELNPYHVDMYRTINLRQGFRKLSSDIGLHTCIQTYLAGLFNRMRAQVAPSGECLRGKSQLDRMLAKPWRRLFLAAYTLLAKPGCCCCPAWQSVPCHCCSAWQTVVCCIPCV